MEVRNIYFCSQKNPFPPLKKNCCTKLKTELKESQIYIGKDHIGAHSKADYSSDNLIEANIILKNK